MDKHSASNQEPLLSRSPLTKFKPSWEILIFAGIVLLAVLSRFYDLGARVISHDETSHVYYAWRLFRGMGYSHDPITHGPFQFHFLAFIYFLFGDNDFTARIPAAISSVATVLFLWKYRRYLGSWGTIAAAAMTLISPFMLYYGRYVRNEAFVALFGVVTIWSLLRYLETRQPRFLYWLSAATVLHFTAKETAFIYTAQAMVFLGIIFIDDLIRRKWETPNFRRVFIAALIAAALFLALVVVAQIAAPEAPEGVEAPAGMPLQLLVPLILVVVSLFLALLMAILGYGWKNLSQLPSFSALLVLGTLVLPQLAPFPVEWVGWEPLDYSRVGMWRTGAFVIGLSAVAVAIGLAWNPQVWLICAGIFYLPFTLLFTTMFTNGAGFFTGLVGSLGYWLDQQAVERGSQPWYYYWLIQVPIYEYLPAIGSFFALIGVGIQRLLSWGRNQEAEGSPQVESRTPVFALLSFWALSSLVAYPIAGEKMPWLTVHIAFPLILLSAYGFQQMMTHFNWDAFRQKNGWLVMLLSGVLVLSLAAALGSLLSPHPPFQGQELHQLRSTGDFLTALVIFAASGVGLAFLVINWRFKQLLITGALTSLAILTVLTIHTAYLAAFIKYDSPEEYLVYAHGGRGVKEALAQIEELSYRTTDGLAMEVAFDNETTYPYWWYLRNYENQRYYAENPTRDLRSAPAILVGNNNYGKLEPVVGNAYYEFTYNRIVWPNQDYFNLTWERIRNALGNPQMRKAIFDIWLHRDYTKYAEVTGRNMSLATWSPADQMRLYIRKDVANKVWNYGTPDLDFTELTADPYEGNVINRQPEISLDSLNLNTPRNLAAAPDGTLYVLDTNNHRVLHIDTSGQILNSWGEFSGNEADGDFIPEGAFNEPWGIDIGPDGSVYVADTWNHRIQKFSSQGEFLTAWGQFGQRETPYSMWGPRDVAVDPQGHVYVTDTGNKRILVFDESGDFLAEFGEVGLGDGQFDEPSGLALDQDGNLYVADTWNQRIQVFAPNLNGIAQTFLRKWDLAAWYGQSLDNKPYLTFAGDGNLYVSDPELSRILVFTPEGDFLAAWGAADEEAGLMSYPTGLDADLQGGIWVSDTRNNRVIRFPVLQEE